MPQTSEPAGSSVDFRLMAAKVSATHGIGGGFRGEKSPLECAFRLTLPSTTRERVWRLMAALCENMEL